MQTTVKITKILPVQSGQGRNGMWYRCEFIGQTLKQYPETICFTCVGESDVQMLGQFKVGSVVSVSFNINSNEYNGKYYTQIKVWKITPAEVKGEQDSGQPNTNDFPADDGGVAF